MEYDQNVDQIAGKVKCVSYNIDVKVESFIHNKMFHSITYIVSTCDPILRLIMTDAEHIKAKLGHKLI